MRHDSIVYRKISINPCYSNKQLGSTLIISLIILVILMLLGVSAVTTSNTQYKLAGNLQFEDAAMNNTETAINAAETWSGRLRSVCQPFHGI